MNTSVPQSPAVVRAGSLPDSIKVEPLTCAIGAQLSNVDLGVASRDPALVAEIRALLLAALRSAVLWRQMGGSLWDFVFRRREMAAAIDARMA